MRRVLAVLVSLSCIWFFGCSKKVDIADAVVREMQDRLNAKIAAMDHLTERSSANCSMQGEFRRDSLWIHLELYSDTDDEVILDELIERAGRDVLEIVTTTESVVTADPEAYWVRISIFPPNSDSKEFRAAGGNGSTLIGRLTERFGG